MNNFNRTFIGQHKRVIKESFPDERNRIELHRHFDHQGWTLWDDRWIPEQMREAAASSYENQIPLVVAKLLLRGQVSEGKRDGRAADL